jgi:hypothetical protein
MSGGILSQTAECISDPQTKFSPVIVHSSSRFAIALAGILALTAGCPGTLDDPAAFLDAARAGELAADGGTSEGGANCPDVPQAVFTANCALAGCHDAQSKMQGLDLQSPDVASRLVGVPATEGPGLLIDPSAPSSSVLYLKLTAMPPFGARMPLAGKLDDATIACVLAWITEQANAGGGSDAGGDLDGGPAADGQASEVGSARDGGSPSESGA